MKKIITFFDKFEDRVRGRLSHYPILYSIVGGIAIVLFWRGVWHTADILKEKGGVIGFLFYEPVNMVLVIIVLLSTGLFVSYFIGDQILLSGIKRQKKATDKTEKEIEEEERHLSEMRNTIKEMKKEVDEIIEVIEHQNIKHLVHEKGSEDESVKMVVEEKK